jgi:hypothetical protein
MLSSLFNKYLEYERDISKVKVFALANTNVVVLVLFLQKAINYNLPLNLLEMYAFPLLEGCANTTFSKIVH